MHERLNQEVDRNFDVFERILPSLLSEHEGEFALMRNGEVVGFHVDERSALAKGRGKFDDGIYSVQEVTRRPADLGFFSHAIDPKIAG